jgi:ribosomal protein L11 methyltransferase
VSWLEVRATLPPDSDTSPFIEIFRDHGIESTQEINGSLVGCLADVEGSAARIEVLKCALQSTGVGNVEVRPLEEQNWGEIWKQFFHPQRIGRRIVVRPSWEPFEARADDIVIVLDPGEAFGTGDHATTRLCLRILEDAVRPGAKVADVGCGSGILAIAACRLGAATVDAVDVDPTSVEVARANAKINGVEFNLAVGEGLGKLTPPYDLIVSNIISAVLIQMAPHAFAALRPGGAWIVSGILSENWPLVRSAAQREGFSVGELIGEDNWVAARLSRP